MALKVAARGIVPPFLVMDVLRQANRRESQGQDVLHLEIGQPAGGAPAAALEAGRRAMLEDPLGYSQALGDEALRQRLARHYAERYQARVAAERIVLTAGASGAFLLAFLTAFAAGDRVGVASPSYPAYRNILAALGVEAVLLPVGADSHFQTDRALLERHGQGLDGLILASPSNPTGSMLAPQALGAVADWCFEQGVRLISDEIYHGLTYGVAEATAALAPGAIVVNSFSKYFAMTGWRLGWMVLPEDLVRPVECLAQNLFIAPGSLAQRVALAALDCREELDARRTVYDANRALLLAELPAAGFDRLAPADGAFYLYADIARWSDDSVAFCHRMLAETGVATTPGVDFDPDRGRHHLRFSFAGAPPHMAEAARRLKAWTK